MTTTLRTRDPGPELPGLVETLDSASAQHFDLAALRVGVDGLVRHRRRRRRQAVVAGGAVAAVLVAGGLTWSLGPGPDAGGVAAPPSPSASAEPSAVVTQVQPPAPTSAVDVDRTVVPDEVGLDVSELRETYAQNLDLTQQGEVHTPPVSGQMCNQGLPGLSSVGGRMWSFSDPASETAGSVSVNVTVFGPGLGGEAVQEVRGDTGQCRWLGGRDRSTQPWAAGGDRVLHEDTEVFGMARYQAVVRSGDVLVGVDVIDERGAEQAQADAQRLADLVAERARASMPAAQD